MSGRFVAIDFETANASLASICQAGVVTFTDGQIDDEWETLIDPEDWFDAMNVGIHGIDEETAQGAPTLPEVIQHLERRMCNQIVVCHTHFDRVALSQALAKYQLEAFGCTWLDSARVTRRCWEEFRHAGYGLSNVCEFLGIQYRAHNALEDARAAGLVLLEAMAHSGLGLPGWLDRLSQHSIGGRSLRTVTPRVTCSETKLSSPVH